MFEWQIFQLIVLCIGIGFGFGVLYAHSAHRSDENMFVGLAKFLLGKDKN